ncbi:MAG: glycosyltransferase family 2 protein [Candidatus Doudnabacteria bacterium]|nr:glycosyltransferase family 2 protein [Candidatus Doudnabacteria bacterium]
MPEVNVQVGIVMPAYNMAQYIGFAIESVQAQEHRSWQLLVIDDGSTDDTALRVAGYAAQDQRVTLIRHAGNMGLIATLNEGIGLITGEFFARLDADDAWLDTRKLTAQIEYLLTHPKCGLVGTDAVLLDAAGQRTGVLIRPRTDVDIRKHMLLYNPFVHSSVMLRTSLVRSLGGYAIGMPHVEDYELWLRVGTRAEMGNIPERAVGYRVSGLGITSRHNREQVLRCMVLVWQYKRHYPYAWLGLCKWLTQYVFVWLNCGRIYNRFKQQLGGSKSHV